MKALFCVLFISVFAFSAFAKENKVSDQQIQEFIQLSGVQQLLDSIPAQIYAMANQQQLIQANPNVDNSVAQILIEAWQPESINESISAYIFENSNSDEITDLLEWRKSPLAKKMTALELASSEPSFQADFLRYMADLQETPPSPETMQVIQRLVGATNMADTMLAMSTQITRGMLSVLTETEENRDKVTQSEIDQQIASMREIMLPQMQQQAILMSYYIYRDVSNDELAQYSSFYESDLGSKELSLLFGSLSLSMNEWAKKSAQMLTQAASKNQ